MVFIYDGIHVTKFHAKNFKEKKKKQLKYHNIHIYPYRFIKILYI